LQTRSTTNARNDARLIVSRVPACASGPKTAPPCAQARSPTGLSPMIGGKDGANAAPAKATRALSAWSTSSARCRISPRSINHSAPDLPRTPRPAPGVRRHRSECPRVELQASRRAPGPRQRPRSPRPVVTLPRKGRTDAKGTSSRQYTRDQVSR
jgi:hypothetical protein